MAIDPPPPGQPTRFATDATSATLLQRVRQRENSAWERLVDVSGPLINPWCVRCGLSPDDANDVKQEVFISISKNIKGFRRERSSDTFRGWLRAITRNHIRAYYRKIAGQPKAVGGSEANERIQDLPDDVLDEMDFESGEDARSIYYRMLELVQHEFEKRTWDAFFGTAVQERQASEAAAELGMSVGAVRQARYKVLRRLREEFAELLS